MVEAGQALFLRDGLRGATMEAIAREAGVAKATLYAYFPDKEAVFAAVTERLVGELTQIVEHGLSGPGEAWLRVAETLAAKQRFVWRLLEHSPHASELYAAGSPGSSPQLAQFERWFEARVADTLRQAGHRDGERLAVLLGACAEGIAHKARDAGQIGPAVRLVTEKLLA